MEGSSAFVVDMVNPVSAGQEVRLYRYVVSTSSLLAVSGLCTNDITTGLVMVDDADVRLPGGGVCWPCSLG